MPGIIGKTLEYFQLLLILFTIGYISLILFKIVW